MASQIPALLCKSSSKGVNTDLVAVFQAPAKKSSKSGSADNDNDKKSSLIPPQGPYSKVLAQLEKQDLFLANAGSEHLVTFGGAEGAENVLFFGLGPVQKCKSEIFRSAGALVWQKLVKFRVKTARVELKYWENKDCPVSFERAVRAFAEGLCLSAYQINRYKTGQKKNEYFGPSEITFVFKGKSAQEKILQEELVLATQFAECVNITRDWSNEPSNIGTPEFFADAAKKLASHYGLKCKILTQSDCHKEKMGLLTGVGQGSVRDDRVVMLEYRPKDWQPKKGKTVCFVGKGVTFDSGGISIKPSAQMEDMKHDMSGAATVMGAIALASEMKVKNRVLGFMGFVENMPDGSAIQPGNILTSRSGKTVEIINTDAEGRLVLADVIDYAQDFKPDCIVDIATLTGAVLIALGNLCTAILGNHDEFIQQIRQAGDENDERIWQLPLWDDYSKDIKSDYADIKNSVNNRLGGTIRGAAFIKEFIRKGVQWAHLDIAATATNLSHHPYHPKIGGSGAIVRTLATLARDYK